MKDKYATLLASIKAKLADAKAALEANDFEKAKGIQAEAATLRAQASVMKAQIDSTDELASDEKDAEIKSLKDEKAKLEAEAKSAVTPPFSTETGEDKPVDTLKMSSVQNLRYKNVDAAVKTVIKDLYGAEYFDKRERQRNAFVKYLRTGDKSFADFALLKGRNIYMTPNLIEDEIKAGRSVAEAKATLEEATLDLGGVLVPEDYRQEITKRLMGLTVVRPRARVIQTNRDVVEWPRLDGGNSQYTSAVRVTHVDETPTSATAAATNPTFGSDTIPVYTVMARTDISQNLLEDSAFNLLDIVAGLFAEAYAIDEDTSFLTGSGGGTALGVLGARASGEDATPVTGVTSVVSGDATALTADGLINLVYGLDAQYRKNAVLIAARNTHRDTRKLKDGVSDYLWAKGLVAGEPASLLNYPFLEDEGMPAIGANTYPILFGDWGGYLIVDRVGMTFDRVEDTTTKGTNTVALFGRRRYGGKLIEPWRFVCQKIAAS